MDAIMKRIWCAVVLTAVMAASAPVSFASVDDAQSFALQAAEPYVKEGFQVREDFWGGDLAAGEKKAVRQQLFKGNEYWFWLGTDVEKASISVHVYDGEGKLVEQPDSWQKGQFAAARVIPGATGTYYIIVSVEQSPEERTHWALVYGFR
ncbi:MAG: hypothetical protein AVDCRST_MAG42-3152 [uncultured Chthoniobacterales bacterium]|uniref:Peptidase C-terminal archaeal/bacterial domain-containing protein n=1 Tax=uncultured Chthoniobacterales bacterium TaxID=1836801 RepID=A0A6J4J1G2_9BACT|nr:MAG: hypothetical protein AVDCRST_MAG42-3152 [uncultured Chthoniobacterales bacterium]